MRELRGVEGAAVVEEKERYRLQERGRGMEREVVFPTERENARREKKSREEEKRRPSFQCWHVSIDS